MSSQVWYMAHPVGGDATGNAHRALRWLRWLRAEERDVCIIAPWLAALLAGEDDTDPKQRERGLSDAEAVVQLCDGIVLVGGRCSSGMQRELDACTANGGQVCDLTKLGDEPPSEEHIRLIFAQVNADAGEFGHRPDGVLELGQAYWEAP